MYSVSELWSQLTLGLGTGSVQQPEPKLCTSNTTWGSYNSQTPQRTEALGLISTVTSQQLFQPHELAPNVQGDTETDLCCVTPAASPGPCAPGPAHSV